ncbi:MAG: hypothetical protein J0I36_00005, partial [Pandoraea sp.]|nr:hypothetical protein [Pandoraea sp.]
NGEMDVIANQAALGDHGDAVAKLDKARGSLLLVILDGDATATKRMTMREYETHGAGSSRFAGCSKSLHRPAGDIGPCRSLNVGFQTSLVLRLSFSPSKG